jgi:predicted transposase YdaD
MFSHSDLKKTRVYQDAVLEGVQIGEQRGLQIGKQEGLQRQVAMLMRMLIRKFGKVNPRLKTRISKLSVIQLENLAEAIFDFETVADLNAWLKTQA